MSRDEVTKVGSMSESPWQEPPKVQNNPRTLTPKNLVHIMEQELKQMANYPLSSLPNPPASPRKILAIKERLQARVPMMGTSHVRVNASDLIVEADPAYITNSTENPHRENTASEDMREWYSNVPEKLRIEFERFSPQQVRNQKQAESKPWQLQIG